MKWRGERQSDRMEDRRGMTPARGGMAIGGGAALLVLLFALFTGQDPQQLLDVIGGGQATVDPNAPQAPTGAPSDEHGQFAATVLASTEDAWTEIFTGQGLRYERPTLVLYSEAVASGCGSASSAVGPFYCPADQKLYLDLTLLRSPLAQRFARPATSPRPTSSPTRSVTTSRTSLGIPTRCTQRCRQSSEPRRTRSR